MIYKPNFSIFDKDSDNFTFKVLSGKVCFFHVLYKNFAWEGAWSDYVYSHYYQEFCGNLILEADNFKIDNTANHNYLNGEPIYTFVGIYCNKHVTQLRGFNLV